MKNLNKLLMKNFYLTLTALLFTVASYAATITAVASGTWNSATTWDLGRVPAAGDVVVIPYGFTVTVTNTVNLSTAATTINNYGNLVLSGGRLSLANGSVVYVYYNGTLSGNGCNCETLNINGTQKYNGTQGTINGPVMANAASTGFVAYSTLPVKFISYNVVKNGNDYQLMWSTAEEVNSYYYEVERSEQGVQWKTVARIQAAGNSSTTKSYSYTDRNVTLKSVHYRVKQADQDGRVTYTAIKTFHNGSLMPVYITGDKSQLAIRFTAQVTGAVEVNIISMSGQVMIRKSYAANSETLTLANSRSLRGQYLVQVLYNNTESFTKQVIF
jgi:hypothetical protein